MSDLGLIHPVGKNYPVTQNYAEHIRRAQQNGWCWKPGVCPGGTYYYGGIDWACPNGTPVYAAAPGTVSKVVQNAAVGYGWAVYVLHANGFTTIYGHMGAYEIKVGAGDKLPIGALLGYSDNTGNSSGPHIHFELRDKTGLAIDPAPFLTGAPVQPPPVEPPVQPPALGDMVKIGEVYRAVGLRTAPDVDDANLILRINGLGCKLRFQRRGEIPANGRVWTEVICYIASDYLESA